MIHPHTKLQFVNKEIGHGVVATQLIPKGTIVWVLDPLDRFFSPEELNSMDELTKQYLDTYTYRDSEGNFILCWDHARFVNHSFESNCLSTAYDFEIAIKDILPGEQLTNDYGYLNIPSPFQAAKEESSRRVVYPNDLLRYHHLWDKQLNEAFPFIPELEQPLKFLLSTGMWQKIEAISNGNAQMASILENYFDPKA